jgi:HAD superfamily hydrolase (TIGR01544 family)
LKDIVVNGHLKFREGVSDFLNFLYEKNIPLVIISASGCGDAIRMFFEKAGKDYSNIIYITNQFIWDKNDIAIGVKEPVINSMNKDETALKKIPEVFDKIKNRKNVILLGDNMEDVAMTEGFEYETLIKIGFLNFDNDQLRQKYKETFDVVLEGDGDFEHINLLIRNLK